MLQSKAGYIDARPLTAKLSKLLATHGRTIHLGQKATSAHRCGMSALPPETDIPVNVHLAPQGVICHIRLQSEFGSTT